MLKSFLNIVLAFNVLISSSGLLLQSHYCQNILIKTGLFLNEGCYCEGDVSDPCGDDGTCRYNDEEDGCCHNESHFFKTDEPQQVQDFHFKTFKKLDTYTAAVIFQHITLPIFDKYSFEYINYSPPPIVFDLQVRLQTFLC